MLRFIDAIPARGTIRRGDSLNILGGVHNTGEELESEISVWANDGCGWRALVTRRFRIGAGEHKHLYFTLEPRAFSPEVWGEAPEELELAIRDTAPQENGVMVFITE